MFGNTIFATINFIHADMRKLLMLLFFAFAIASYAQDMDCQKYKNGIFKIVDEQHGTSYLIRKGKKQIEFGDDFGLKLALKVEWDDDCVYTLYLKKVLKNPKNETFPENMFLRVEIIEVTDDYYVQRTTSNLFSQAIESKVYQIDESELPDW